MAGTSIQEESKVIVTLFHNGKQIGVLAKNAHKITLYSEDLSEDEVTGARVFERGGMQYYVLDIFQRLLPDAEIDRLDALYPDYKIDVEAEQAKLVAADTIVLQYPVFWYGMPALLQKWVEDVFAHGFSHGSKGKALVGKNLILSMTLGAPDEAYGEDAAVRLDDLLPPAKGMCAASGMNFSGWEHCDYVTYATRVNEEACDAIAEKARKLAGRVVERIRGL